MAAHTHTRTPAPSVRGVDARLPWWALALPVAAFVALFVLVTAPGGAQAAGGDPGVGRLLEQIRQTLPH
ncbi:hypothetical protein EAO71_09980 [Streptomyces sp. ms191]|nr:hypothetical protein [Streptomyces sp. ms191]TXS30952.1 hypothetical protein EAO71_09980 [Streptomyces sp. ms191]